jgi:hypothetical protein
LSRLFRPGRVGIAWSTVAVLGGRPCPAIGGSLGWVGVVGVEGRALAKAHSGPGECSEAEPGRYRARFVLGCARVGCQNQRPACKSAISRGAHRVFAPTRNGCRPGLAFAEWHTVGSELLLPRDDRFAVAGPSTCHWCGRVRYTRHFRLRGRKPSSPSPQGGGLGTRPAGSSALLSAKRVSCAPAFLSPLGGSRFLVSGFSERRPDAQIALPVRLSTDQAVAKCFRFLAGPELGDDLSCPTVDNDECFQVGGLRRLTHQTPNLRC